MQLITWVISNKIKATVSVIMFIFALYVAMNSFTIVQPGNAKVGTLFGKVQNEPLTEGFHIVNPLVSFDIYSIKDFTVTWDNIKVPAQDKLKSGMDLAVTLTAKTANLPRMKREAGSLQDAFGKYVTPRVFSLLRECGKGVLQSQDFFKDEVQNQMQDFMLSNLREQLLPLGFDVKIALFSDVTLPPLVQQAIEATKKRQEKVNQERAQLEIVELEQQKTVKIAEAAKDAAISQATAMETMATAKAFKTLTEATAEAKANKLLSESISTTLIDYVRANNWNGVLPQTMIGEGVTPLVSIK